MRRPRLSFSSGWTQGNGGERDAIGELDWDINTLRDELVAFESFYQQQLGYENQRLSFLQRVNRYFERWRSLTQRAADKIVPEHYEEIEHAATAFLEPLRPNATKRDDWPRALSGLLKLNAERIVVSALKEAEDGNGIVLRTYNATPEPASGEIIFGSPPSSVQHLRIDEQPTGETAELVDGVLTDQWRAYEIKTYRLEF